MQFILLPCNISNFKMTQKGWISWKEEYDTSMGIKLPHLGRWY